MVNQKASNQLYWIALRSLKSGREVTLLDTLQAGPLDCLGRQR